MSFNDMTMVQLKQIAEEFAVETPSKITKNSLIDLLHADGVTYEIYAHFDKISKEKEDNKREEEEMQAQFYINQSDAVRAASNQVLVKMERSNASYQSGRYVFTQEHPFVAMPIWDAQYIFDTESGFRLATPSEVQSYYN